MKVFYCRKEYLFTHTKYKKAMKVILNNLVTPDKRLWDKNTPSSNKQIMLSIHKMFMKFKKVKLTQYFSLFSFKIFVIEVHVLTLKYYVNTANKETKRCMFGSYCKINIA